MEGDAQSPDKAGGGSKGAGKGGFRAGASTAPSTPARKSSLLQSPARSHRGVSFQESTQALAQLETMMPSLSKLVALAKSGAFGSLGGATAEATGEGQGSQGHQEAAAYGAARAARAGGAGARRAAAPYVDGRGDQEGVPKQD